MLHHAYTKLCYSCLAKVCIGNILCFFNSIICAPYACSHAGPHITCGALCREKKLAAKAQGRRHASSDEDESEDEAAQEDEGASAGEEDPFFQHEDNPFDDPFFRVCSHACVHVGGGGPLSGGFMPSLTEGFVNLSAKEYSRAGRVGV